MIQLCAAWKTSQILSLAEKGELPGHSTALNVIANYSFANIPSEGVIIYSGKGPQISYLESSFYTVSNDIKSYIVSTFKEHHDKLKWAAFKWLAFFLVLLVFSIIMLIVVPVFGGILFVVLILSPFCLVCYQRKIYEDYNQVLIPGIIGYVRDTLLPKYAKGNNNICAYLLYPATWNTTVSDCNCGGPNLQWMTIRFTVGNIQEPHGAPIHWSSVGQVPMQQSGTSQYGVKVQPQPYAQTYGMPSPNETTPMVQSHGMQQSIAPMEALPSGWRMAKTNEGKVYYVNDVTKVTQWERPYEVQQTQQTAPMMRNEVQQNITTVPDQQQNTTSMQNVAPVQTLPSGWREAKTNEGRVYYVNDITKTTQWHYPTHNV